jgi:hypothetical protein
VLGVTLIGVAWPASWLHLGTLGEYSFFPLWMGYILVVDAAVFRLTGTSLMVRSPRAFAAMFLVSVPMWWFFEGINYFTQNWRYVGAQDYSVLRYFVVASLHFSIVVPAVLETAELVGSFRWVLRLTRGPRVPLTVPILGGMMLLGGLSVAALILWPGYAFPLTWMSLFLLLDPANRLRGRPSILGYLSRGDWRPVVALGLGALMCGFFWEMWNHWAFPKWEYAIPGVDSLHLFQMPLPGYAGYLPFGLEVFAVYQFLAGLAESVQALRKARWGARVVPKSRNYA